MALFQKSYKDILRELKAETEKKEKQSETNNSYEMVPNTTSFTPYIYDMSDMTFEPYDTNMFYKKSQREFFEYEIPVEEKELLKRKFNYFKQVLEYLTTVIKDRLINDDYLTGYFIAKELLPIKSRKIKVFMAGLTKDSMLHGIIDSLGNKKIKVEYNGCDKYISSIHKQKYYNGVSKKCNIHDINSAVSINIELGEKISVKSLDLYIADIKATNTYDVLCSYIIQHTFMSKNGTIILRLPNVWKDCSTSMITLLLYFISQYKSVRIFKTPWGQYSRNYVLLYGLKETISQTKKNNLISYAKELKDSPNIPLYRDVVFDTEYEDEYEKSNNAANNYVASNDENKDSDCNDTVDIDYEEETKDEEVHIVNDPKKLRDKSAMELLIDNIVNTHNQILTYDEKYTKDQMHDMWIELIS
jgi:hypothetical protein